MGEVVCEICGSSINRFLIVKCVKCSSHQHRYCMPVVKFSAASELLCSECQEKANENPSPNQGAQNVLQSSCGITKERETQNLDLGHSNVMHPTSHNTWKKFSSAKVKFISSEEVALLNRDRRPHGRSNSAVHQSQKIQVRPASPPNLKQSSSMKCVSLKRSVPASHDKPNIDSRSDTQVQALKRFVSPSHEARKKDLSMNKNAGHGSSMSMTNRCRTEAVVDGIVETRIEDKTKENNTVSADKGKIPSQMQHECTEEAFVSVYASGCESEAKSPSCNIGTLLIMDSNVANPRRPSSTNCWTGCFLVLYAGTRHNLGEFKAYLPSKVLPRVYDIANAMPTTLELEMLPRMDDWPITFKSLRPTHEDIGLFFFSNKFDWHEENHSNLLETSKYVIRGYINDIKLLIYSSEVLPPDSQWVDGKSYLWGVFVRPKGKKSHLHLTSTST